MLVLLPRHNACLKYTAPPPPSALLHFSSYSSRLFHFRLSFHFYPFSLIWSWSRTIDFFLILFWTHRQTFMQTKETQSSWKGLEPGLHRSLPLGLSPGPCPPSHCWVDVPSSFLSPLRLATIIILIILLLLSVICVFPCLRRLGLLVWKKKKKRHGIFDVLNDLSACCAHEGETGTDVSAQALKEELKTVLYPVSTGSPQWPHVPFTGSPAQRTNHWAWARIIQICVIRNP